MNVSDNGVAEEDANNESVPVQNNVAQVHFIYLFDQLLDNITRQAKDYQVSVQFLRNYLEKYDFLSYTRLGDLLSVVANQALGYKEPEVITCFFSF